MCVLRVTGKRFDADLYLERSGLTAYMVIRAGEPRLMSQPEKGRHERSGFMVDVSRHTEALSGQVRDAIAFLKKHEQALVALRAAPGLDDMRLDFPVDLRIDRQKVFAQFDYVSPGTRFPCRGAWVRS